MSALLRVSPPRRGAGPHAVRRRLSERWVVGLLFVAFTLVRLPFRSRFLISWDAVNFALGVQSFDLVHHQPHPPGYLGYVLLGRAFAWFAGGPNAGLTLLSVVAGAILPAATYALARRFVSRRAALLAAVLLGTSPVVWYYSVVALTYVVAAAVIVPLVWAAHVARQRGSARHLVLAAGLGVVLGAVRQTDVVFMLPVLVYAAWPFRWRTRLAAGAVLAVGTAAWAIPLLVLSGGLSRYLELSRELAVLAGGRTWILGLHPVGIAQNLGLVLIGVLLGLNVGLLGIVIARRRGLTGFEHLDRDMRRLAWLWAVPALLVFLFVHTGQIGYVLLFLPIGALWFASIAEDWLGVSASRDTTGPGPLRRLADRAAHATPGVRRTVVTVAVAALVNTAAFVAYPAVNAAAMGREDSPAMQAVATSTVQHGGVPERMRQYSIGWNDRYWSRVTSFVDSYPARQTALLSVPVSGGTYRQLGFYLRRYRVYGLGMDRHGHFGYLFGAHDGHNGYTVAGLDHARRWLQLPQGVRWLMVPDRDIQSRLPRDLVVRRLRLAPGPDMLVYAIPGGSQLRFVDDLDGEAHIVVRFPDGSVHDNLPSQARTGELPRQVRFVG